MKIDKLSLEIEEAIESEDITELDRLFGTYNEALKLNTPFGSWLHIAASDGKLEVIKKLLDLGIDINIKGGIYGGTPLNEAASEGQVEVVDYLLKRGAEIETIKSECNPLFSAIVEGSVEIVKLLVSTGMDIHLKYNGTNMKNMDALSFAELRGEKKIAEILKNI